VLRVIGDRWPQEDATLHLHCVCHQSFLLASEVADPPSAGFRDLSGSFGSSPALMLSTVPVPVGGSQVRLRGFEQIP
jgi:hypothetical protein